MSNDYITSERFIHDDLITKSERVVNKLYDFWKAEGKVDPSLLTWPAEPILTDDGQKVDGVCAIELPVDMSQRSQTIRNMVKRTKAYGLLLVETREGQVQAILETPHGTRCWTIPIKKSGDVQILGEPIVTDDKENVGILWSPARAVA